MLKINKLSHLEILEVKPSITQVKKLDRIPVIILLDNIRSSYNIGSIFRTSDALLIKKIYLTGICGQPPNKEIEKVALGAVHTVPWEYKKDAYKCAKQLKKEGNKLIALELTHQSIDYKKAEYNFPLVLVVGNEIDGVNDKILEICDFAVDIQMNGRANSLNVATATAVVGYEILYKYQNL